MMETSQSLYVLIAMESRELPGPFRLSLILFVVEAGLQYRPGEIHAVNYALFSLVGTFKCLSSES